jgi:hypothetical protein
VVWNLPVFAWIVQWDWFRGGQRGLEGLSKVLYQTWQGTAQALQASPFPLLLLPTLMGVGGRLTTEESAGPGRQARHSLRSESP